MKLRISFNNLWDFQNENLYTIDWLGILSMNSKSNFSIDIIFFNLDLKIVFIKDEQKNPQEQAKQSPQNANPGGNGTWGGAS